METSEQLTRFRDFFESNKESVHEAVARGEKSAVFDFKDLLVHDPELADSLLDDPENLLKAAELSMTKQLLATASGAYSVAISFPIEKIAIFAFLKSKSSKLTTGKVSP